MRKGYDPREFALVAFGGAGPLFALRHRGGNRHSASRDSVYPGSPPRVGLLATDVSYDFARTDFQKLGNADLQRLSDTYAALEHAARAQLDQDGIAPERMTFTRYADCRYEGQGYEVRAPAPAGALDESFAGICGHRSSGRIAASTARSSRRRTSRSSTCMWRASGASPIPRPARSLPAVPHRSAPRAPACATSSSRSAARRGHARASNTRVPDFLPGIGSRAPPS